MNILLPSIPFILWLQSWPLHAPMLFLSALGSSYFYLGALPLIYWSINRRIGLNAGALLLANLLMNSLLKVLFSSPRPFWVSPQIYHWGHQTSFGLPSGHTQGAIVFWLFLALQIHGRWRRPAIGAAFAISALVGLSRMYLGAHFPADVLAGFVAGLVVLASYLAIKKYFRPKGAAPTNPSKFILLTCYLCLGLLCYALVLHLPINRPFLPMDAQALSQSNMILAAGALFGLSIGILTRRSPFSDPVNILMSFLRFVSGVTVLAILWFCLRQLLVIENDMWNLSLHFIGFTVIGWWVIDGAPRLFGLWERNLRSD